jgi:hypothetical protein
MDDIKEAAGRRRKTIEEARTMAMTRKDFRRWTEDPTADNTGYDACMPTA